MSKIFGYYLEGPDGVGLDKAWYDSSNVKYSECVDKEGELKTIRVVFNNGSQYEYKGVDVSDYMLLREDTSQGKALNKYIKGKKYEYARLDDRDIEKLDDELRERLDGYLFVSYEGGVFTVRNNVDVVLYEKSGLSDETVSVVCDILVSTGNKVKLNGVKYGKQ